MEFWGLHLSSGGPSVLAFKNATVHITKAVLLGKDATATDADRVHVCYRDKAGHKFVLCVLRNSIGQDQATLDVRLTSTAGCSMFLQVHSAARSGTPETKVVLTGYLTHTGPQKEGLKDDSKRALTVPPSPSQEPAQQKRKRENSDEKVLEELKDLRENMFGAKVAKLEGESKQEKEEVAVAPAQEEGDEGEEGDYDEGDEFDESLLLGAFDEGDEGDEGDEELDEATLRNLGFISVPAPPAAKAADKKPATKAKPPAEQKPNEAKPQTPANQPPAAARLSRAQKKQQKAQAQQEAVRKLEAAPAPIQQKKAPQQPPQKKGFVKLPSGLQYEDTVVGTGAVANRGNRLQMRYKGMLATGQVFDSNMPRGRPFGFTLGAGEVIRGWDEGLQGMRVGGKRTLKIPSALGYGSRGAGPKIPPNANLTFEVELLSKA